MRATFPKLEIAILITTGGYEPTITGGKSIRPSDVMVIHSKSVSDNLGSILNDGEKAGIDPVALSDAIKMPSEVPYVSNYRNPNVDDVDGRAESRHQ
jgi:hypothetical protein